MTNPLEIYEARAAKFAARSQELGARADRVGHARLAAFIAALIFGILAEQTGAAIWRILAAVLLAGFVILVVVHRRLRREEEWFAAHELVNREGVSRLNREWSKLPALPVPPRVYEHAYAGDLQLFGRPGLSQLLVPPATPAGQRMLTKWLLTPDAVPTIEARQASVGVLRDAIDFRDALAVRARETSRVTVDELEQFLSWSESPPVLRGQVLLRVLAIVLPVATFGLMFAQALGYLDRPWWLLGILSAILVTARWQRQIHSVFRRAFAREGVLRAYPNLFEQAASVPTNDARLAMLAVALTVDDVPAAHHFRKLERIMRLADVRHSGTLHFIVQTFTLWDIHVAAALEKWQQRAGPVARRWFEALGEIEATSGLAALAHDNPGWPFPRFTQEHVFRAKQIGHPMIPDAKRVHNDIEVGPPGTFLLVTGSNMSGKSTLLRAIGANVVLAQAGAPVCAQSLGLPHVALYTSVNIQDSLVDGVSLFMAELQRMRGIVEAAARGDHLCMYLLDEILHGTNSAERRIAVRSVLQHLLRAGAIGAITTHDLALAEDPAIDAAARKVHFTETVSEADGSVKMSFDYRARPGLATSTNALTLMRLVGITPTAAEDAAGGQ